MNRIVRIVTQPKYHRTLYKVPDSSIFLFQEFEQLQHDDTLSYSNYKRLSGQFLKSTDFANEEEEFEYFQASLYAIYH